MLQTLFMNKCIDHMAEVDATAGILKQVLGEEQADAKLAQLRCERAIPTDTDAFRSFVLEFFLEKGIPVKIFAAKWKVSLDDAQGQSELWSVLESAYDRTRKGQQVHVKGTIFEPSDPKEVSEQNG
jgi:hypothetical protein